MEYENNNWRCMWFFHEAVSLGMCHYEEKQLSWITPKNWLFKDINGITYSDEVLFKKDFIMSWCPNCKDLVDTYKEWYQDEEGDIITEYFCEECGYNISHYEDKLKRNGK